MQQQRRQDTKKSYITFLYFYLWDAFPLCQKQNWNTNNHAFAGHQACIQMQITLRIFKWDFFLNFSWNILFILRMWESEEEKKMWGKKNRKMFAVEIHSKAKAVSFEAELHPYVGHDTRISSLWERELPIGSNNFLPNLQS